jgi:hypothetical protein
MFYILPMKNKTTTIKNLVLLSSILCFGVSSAFAQNDKALPAPINTNKFTEFAPSVSADGKTLIFESDRQGDWKLFESHRNGKNWSVPTAIPKITTTFFEKAPLGGPCISYFFLPMAKIQTVTKIFIIQFVKKAAGQHP